MNRSSRASWLIVLASACGRTDNPDEVMPLPSGRAIPLGDQVFDANFRESTGTLYLFHHPAMDVTTSLYTGYLSIWTPKLEHGDVRTRDALSCRVRAG